MATTTAPLASVIDFLGFGSNQELTQNQDIWTQPALARLMLRATAAVESKCQTKLAPFTGHVESCYARGIGADEYGFMGDMAMDQNAAIGMSTAASFGVSDMVRRYWLDQVPPRNQELWVYNVTSIELLRTFGDVQFIDGTLAFGAQLWQGPEVDTGMIRMPIGTLCPQGTTIRTTYDGGYNVSIPEDLNLACILQAMKFLLVGAEPELRAHMETSNLDDELNMLLAPYVRICG